MPTPPTDSLYKFIAISGLLLLGVGLVAPLFVEQDRQDRYIRRRLETEDRIRGLIFKFSDLLQKDNFKDDQKRLLAIQDVDQGIATIAKHEHEQFQEEVKQHRAVYDLQMSRLGYARVIGGVLTVLGFLLWWRQSQRYQDELLRTEVEKKRSEIVEQNPGQSQPKGGQPKGGQPKKS